MQSFVRQTGFIMVYVKTVNFFTLTNMNGLSGSTQRADRFLSIEARQIEKPLDDSMQI